MYSVNLKLISNKLIYFITHPTWPGPQSRPKVGYLKTLVVTLADSLGQLPTVANIVRLLIKLTLYNQPTPRTLW